ncbi:unnamed protein product [Malus baccata var. baccata]
MAQPITRKESVGQDLRKWAMKPINGGSEKAKERHRMTETRTTNKRKMADRRGEADSEKTSNWPSIKPKKNLQLTPPKDTNLFTVQNFLTSAESNAFVKAAESMRFVHQGSLGPTKGEAYRDNDRISVNDPVLADTIWESGLNKLFSDIKIRGRTAVGLNRISDSIVDTVRIPYGLMSVVEREERRQDRQQIEKALRH